MRTFSLLSIFTLLVLPVLPVFVQDAEAQAPEVSVEEQCYVTLKDNMRETTMLVGGAEYLDKLSYQDLESQFSKKYKTLSSLGVGIGIDEPRFATRLFSFGEPTGYVHPPQTIFPDSQQSEAWSTTTKQYIMAEEYIIDDAGTEHFLSCFFIGMTAPDLLNVTAENYIADAPGISLLKMAPDKSYKAWYASVPSFAKGMEPLVTWEKMFIYPQAATNPYFDKYTVAEAYPANAVEDFSVLQFLGRQYLKVEEFDQNTNSVVTKYMDIESGEELTTPASILPVVRSGVNRVHPLTSYYQAIEAAFPEFAKLLSVSGTIKFNTFIELVTGQNQNPELAKFMDAFMRAGQYNEYYKLKQDPKTNDSAESPLFDRVIPLLQHGEWTVAKLKAGAQFDTLVYAEEAPAVPVTPAPETAPSKLVYVLALLVALLTAGFLYKQLHKTRNQEQESTLEQTQE